MRLKILVLVACAFALIAAGCAKTDEGVLPNPAPPAPESNPRPVVHAEYGKASILKFKIVIEDKSIIDQTKKDGKSPAGYEIYYSQDDTSGLDGKYGEDWVIVKIEDGYNLDGKYIDRVTPSNDEYGALAVGITFDAAGGNLFSRITGENVGKQLAIIMNDQLVSAPKINERIYGDAIISRPGGFSVEEYDQLKAVLESPQQ